MKILHLLDNTCGWEQRVALTQILERLRNPSCSQTVASVDPYVPENLLSLAGSAKTFASGGWGSIHQSLRFRRWVEENNITLVHAWGFKALAFAAATLQGRLPLLISVFDPCPTERQINVIRTAASVGPGAAVCSAATVRRRLLERGVAMDRCVLIRPGVDFGFINEQRRRRNPIVGLPGNGLLVLSDEMGSGRSGQQITVHAAAIRRYLDPNIRVMVPGLSDRSAYFARRATSSHFPDVLIPATQGKRFEEYLCAADILVLPVNTDIATTAIAWAMAASVLVIAGAVYATSELLAHQHNALLLKPDAPSRMAVKIARMIGERSDVRKLTDAARGQAFEVFGVRRSIDQHHRLYENLSAGIPAGDGIIDSAAAG